jgi:O-antigen/teichoic acid export membrane protein
MAGAFAKLTGRIPRTVYAFGASLILMPLSLANGILIARTVGPSGKGALDLILATAGVLTMVLGFSLSPGVTYVVAKGNVNVRSLAFRLLGVAAAQTVITLVILVLLANTKHSAKFLPPGIGWWLIPGIALFVLLEILTAHWRAMLVGRQQITKVNNVEMLARVIQFLLLFSVAAILASQGGQISVAVLFVLALIVSAFINITLLVKLKGRSLEDAGTASFREVVSFATPSYLGNLAQFLNYRLDVFIVSIFAGYASVGRYTLAVGLGQLLWLLSNAAATVLLPKIAAAEHENSAAHTMRVNRLSLGASFAGAIVLALVATQFIPLFYGEDFRGSINALLWILPGIVAFSIVNVLAAYLAGIGKPRLNLIVATISLIATVSLDVLLIPRFDIVGAALASSVSYTLSAVLTIRYFIGETKTPLREVLLLTSSDVRSIFAVARPLLRRTRLLGSIG